MIKSAFTFIIVASVLLACQTKTETTNDPNPPAAGFNLESSDPQAIAIADRVMDAMGGREAWDNTRYIGWNFFGSRKLLWDRQSNWVRIEDQRSDLKININVATLPLEGSVYKEGSEMTNPDSLSYYLDRGKRIWINDSYWLVMPFKLKDSGVTLKYVGIDTTQSGEMSEKIRLTFEKVGVTPQNAYDVWVSRSTGLVNQWAYYREATDEAPAFILPWQNYQTYGNIYLSGDRGERQLTEIEVLEQVNEDFFQSFDEGI